MKFLQKIEKRREIGDVNPVVEKTRSFDDVVRVHFRSSYPLPWRDARSKVIEEEDYNKS